MLAAGRAGITPTQFWEMTPREVAQAVRAHVENFKALHKLLAWQAAAIINHNGMTKKGTTMEKLMGKAGKSGLGHAMFMTKEEWVGQFAKNRELREAKAFWGESGRAPPEMVDDEEDDG